MNEFCFVCPDRETKKCPQPTPVERIKRSAHFAARVLDATFMAIGPAMGYVSAARPETQPSDSEEFVTPFTPSAQIQACVDVHITQLRQQRTT